MELFKAHNQWKTRPVDERFKSVQELHNACSEYRLNAAEASVKTSTLQIITDTDGQDLKLVGSSGTSAVLSNWAMGQISQKAGAPASYLRTLPAELAALNLNHGLARRVTESPNDEAQLLFHTEGQLTLRAATSESYARIWNSDITARLLQLQETNPEWTNPMAYNISEPGKNGNWPTMSQDMEPSGLYASDHDMFAFLVDESKTIKGSPSGLNRGFLCGTLR